MDFSHVLKQNNEIEKSKEYNCGSGVSQRSLASNYSPVEQAPSARTKQPSKRKSSRDTIEATKGINAGTKLSRYITIYILIWSSNLLIIQFLSFSVKTDLLDNLNLGVTYRYDNSLGTLFRVNVIYLNKMIVLLRMFEILINKYIIFWQAC